MYLQTMEQSQHDLNCQVTVMVELTTVNHHHGAMAMSSDISYVCLQCVATSHCLRVGDDVGDICLVLVHPINYEAKVLGWMFL